MRRLAAEGRRDLLTLGVTPVLAAQLDDPHCLRGVHDWLGGWLLRAHGAATRLPDLAAYEHRAATAALADFETHWRHGASPLLRALTDAGAVELLGGPATHPFGPLLLPQVRAFALETGLADTALRLGARPTGIWAPECGYAPGMEDGYAAAGVRRFLVDGPALHGDTAFARPVGASDVVAFGRDLDVTYRVWSPRSGYPGGRDYRDFHTYDHPSGLKPARVTGRSVPPEEKRPYDPERAAAAVARDAADFVSVVRERLLALQEQHGRPALTVAAFDTELFGHWWHEGPAWLEAVLRALPAAGVRVTTLRGALDAGLVGDPVGAAPVVVGIGQGLAGVGGRAGGRPRRAERRRAEDPRERPRPRPDPRPGGRRARPGGAARPVQRLGVHGQQGLRGRLRPRARRDARRPRRRARPPPRRRADGHRAPPRGHLACWAVRTRRRPRVWAIRQNGC